MSNIDALTAEVRGRRFTMLAIAFPIAMIGGGLVIRRLHLGWIGMFLFLALTMILMLAMVRAAQARAQASGCSSSAMLRYNSRMMAASMVYMLAFFLAVVAYKQWHVRGPGLWLAATGPSLGLLGMIWAMARLVIEETDEYLRSRVIRQALVALAGLLTVTTIWGMFEQFDLVPHVPAWAGFPIFAMFLGWTAIYDKLRA